MAFDFIGENAFVGEIIIYEGDAMLSGVALNHFFVDLGK